MKLRLLAVSMLLAAMVLFIPMGSTAAAEKITLEVAVFQGGFGLDHFEYVAREYEKLHPDVKVNVWGNPRIGVVLRPRFLQGNPPDVVWLVREGINNAELLRSGQLAPLTEAMKTPAYFDDKPWKDTILKSTLYTLTDGSDNIWGVSLDLLTWQLWYNKKMFDKYGWKPPKTYDEWLKLNDEIKAKGIIPIALQGKISDYSVYWMMAFIQRQGGLQALNAALNFEPGAWDNPTVIEAAKKFVTLMKRGDFQKGAMAMDHMQAQTLFVQGKAAMVANGSWQPAEMANLTPQGFEMIPFPYPAFKDGTGDPSVLHVMASEKWVVPAKAKHKEQAIDFIKFLTSAPMAKRFAETKDSLTTIPEANAEAKLSKETQAIATLLKNANGSYDHVSIEGWYPKWFGTWKDLTTSLLLGEVTPEQYAKKMEQASRETREDSSIKKFKVNFQ